MSQQTKFCKNCGKELPLEATFCPYCMTKLIDVTTGKEIKIKKKKPFWLFVLILVLIVLAIVGTVLFLLWDENTNDTVDNKGDSVTSTTIATTEENTTTTTKSNDLSGYIGIWCDKNSDIETTVDNGGNILEIVSVKGNVVRFNFTKTSSSPQNRIARITNVVSKVIDNVGTFTFEDDNWQNSGSGKIKFFEDEIYIQTTVLNKNSDAMWDIGGKFYMKKSITSVLDFESNNCLNQDFNEQKNFFGEELEGNKLPSDGREPHFYKEFEVWVNTSTNKITEIYCEYSSNEMTKSDICYGDIDGNSTYDDVYSYLGEPLYNNIITSKRATYKIKGGYVIFYFDENMNLTHMSLICDDVYQK